MKVLTAALLLCAAGMGGVLAYRDLAPRPLHGTALDRARALPAVPLTRDDGKTVSFADSGGRTRLVFFGFTRCPDVCPATLGVLARTYQALTPQQRAGLEVQLVSVDPGFDTPQVLRRYLNAFDPAFRGLTGSQAQITAAEKAMFVYAVKGSGPAVMVHGDAVGLVNRQGQFVRVYNNDAVARGQLAADLPQVIGE